MILPLGISAYVVPWLVLSSSMRVSILLSFSLHFDFFTGLLLFFPLLGPSSLSVIWIRISLIMSSFPWSYSHFFDSPIHHRVTPQLSLLHSSSCMSLINTLNTHTPITFVVTHIKFKIFGNYVLSKLVCLSIKLITIHIPEHKQSNITSFIALTSTIVSWASDGPTSSSCRPSKTDA